MCLLTSGGGWGSGGGDCVCVGGISTSLSSLLLLMAELDSQDLLGSHSREGSAEPGTHPALIHSHSWVRE